MSQLSFKFNAGEDSSYHEVRIFIDENDLLADSDMIGIDPVEFFEQKALLDSGKLYIGRCNCGVIGCGSWDLTVSRTENTVEWSLENPEDTKYVFDLAEYERLIQESAENKAWETVDRTAERFVRQMDFSQAKALGLTFAGVSADILNKEVIQVWFTQKAEPPKTPNVFYEVPWNWEKSEDAVTAVQQMLDRWEASGKPGKPTWQG